MNCEYFRDHLVAYLRDELLPKEREQMSSHAEVCPKCSRELRKTMSALNIAGISEEAPVIRVTYAFIQEALNRNASDLHFEKRRGGALRARCRVDGVLTDLNNAVRESFADRPEVLALLDCKDEDRTLGYAVMGRLKTMADVDPAESDLPQKGRIGVVLDNKDYNLSVSFMPVEGGGGEDAVCRIIPRQSPLTLDALGLSDQLRAAIDRIISQPMGVVLIGGPSGSGKTTVALSLAQHLASPDKKTVTVEDPVFYKMDNVTQIEVADHKGLTASALLSRVIWLDPDVVVAPGLNDGDVARKVADLSMEGTLVIMPIHADDAAETLWNFTHMPDRMLPYSYVLGATNQRLVRRICADCREEYAPSPESLASLGIDPSTKLEHGAGCKKCRNTGHFQRAQIMEALDVNAIYDALAKGAGPKHFYDIARPAISPTLAEDGRRLVLEGVTTAEEVCRVLGLPR